jgi:hypothetical protein
MGDSIKAIHDDYEEYEYLCERLNIKPVSIYNNFYTHEREILNEYLTKYEVKDKWELYKKLKDV